MQRFQDVAQDALGNVVQGVSVSVLLQGTQTLATIFSDNGVTTIPNPVTTDALGTYFFYAANGRYDLQLTKTGLPTTQRLDVLLFDAGSASLVAGQLVFGAAGNTFAQDSNLFWDNVNKRLGIAQPVPTVPLDVTGTIRATTSVVTPLVSPSGSTLQLGAAGSTVKIQPLDANPGVLQIWHGSQGLGLTLTSTTTVRAVDSGDTNALVLRTNNGAIGFGILHIANSVNFPQAAGSASGGGTCEIDATGTDTNIGFFLSAKGTSAVNFRTDISGAAPTQFQVLHTASANQFPTATGGNGINAKIGTNAGGLDFTSATIRYPNIGTTANAANATLNAVGSNDLLRSTSSMRYKTDVADLLDGDLAALDRVRLVRYRSASENDDPARVHYGMLAEDVAGINPILVTTTKLALSESLELDVPDWVQYERFIPLLIEQGRRDRKRISALEAKLR